MLLIHGHRTVKRKRGYVVEVCPSCQQIRSFKILRVARVPHLLFAPLGDGETLGYLAKCAVAIMAVLWVSSKIPFLNERPGATMGMTAFLAVLWLVIELKNEPKRFFNKKILPLILSELKVLRPDRQELDELFRRFKAREYHIAQVTSSEKIVQAMHTSALRAIGVEGLQVA